MKKLAFLFVAVAAISFASCGGGTQATEKTADSTECCGDSIQEECSSDSAEAAVVDTAAVEEAVEVVEAE